MATIEYKEKENVKKTFHQLMCMVNMTTISQVKQKVMSLKGTVVPVKVNKGRNKIVSLDAKIDQVYPSMFVIKPTSQVDLDRMSYSYNDVLCGDIMFL